MKSTTKKRTTTPKLLPLDKTISYVRARLPKNRGYSRSSIYRLVQAKKFPEPVKIGANSFWRVKELNGWITKLIDGE